MNILNRISGKIRHALYGAKRYKYLFEAVRQTQSKRIMEVGTWNGRRATAMIQEAAKFHPVSEIEYYGFDLFEEMTPEIYAEELSKTPPTQVEVEAMLKATGAQIHLYKGFTNKTMPEAVPQLPAMDFIFIDGGHSVETIQNDWEWSAKLMHEKTIVIFDDYYFDRVDLGAKPVVEKIDPTLYEAAILPQRDTFKKDWGTLSVNFVRVTKR